jgi:hypothetical protein
MTRQPVTLIARARSARHLFLAAILAITALGATTPASTSAAVTCAATFGGNATGSQDVTSSLTSFLRKYNGKQVCLKPNGVYRVDGIVRIDSLSGLRLDGRGATLKAVAYAPASAHRRQIYIVRSSNIVISNLVIRGKNPDFTRWNADRQHEHGIWIDGGRSITVRAVTIRDTYGDGIHLGFKDGALTPPTAITLDRVNIARTGRNGIGIVSGNYVLIRSGVIVDAGLHAIVLEPDYSNADIHHVTVTGSTMRRFGRSGIDTGYAFGANGKAGWMHDISVVTNTADRFKATIRARTGTTHKTIVFTGNRSELSSTASFANIVGLTFSGNVRISAYKTNVR